MIHILFRNLKSQFSITTNPRNPHYNSRFLLSLQSLNLRSISTTPSSITQDYLVNSCGFTSETAFQLAKKIQLKRTETPNAVLNMLKSYGISDIQRKDVILKAPKILLCRPDTTLKPKLEFLRSVGVKGPDIAEIFTRDVEFYQRSLENVIVPACNVLRRYFKSHENFVSALKQSGRFCSHLTESSIAILCEYGVKESNIVVILKFFTRTLRRTPEEFRKVVEEVKNMGFNPSTLSFCLAVRTMCGLSESTWKRKWGVYKKLGFTDEEILSMFKKEPFCLMSSEEKINQTVEFFTNKFKWKISDITSRPDILLCSLEKKIIPRWNVLKILNSEGVQTKMDAVSLKSVFKLSERIFLLKYVIPYQQTVPEVGNVYQRKIPYKKEDATKELA